MPIKIKNWTLAILALIFICFFTALGFWQLARAQQKKHLLQTFAERVAHAPLTAKALSALPDYRFCRLKITGFFDNQHTFLLDNKIFQGKIGYEIYTPFYSNDLAQPILVDRGFVAIQTDRNTLPTIITKQGMTTIIGLINVTPRYVAFGPITDADQNKNKKWPLRVEYVNLAEMGKLVTSDSKTTFFPYLLALAPHSEMAYPLEWQIVTMGPERHLAYAVQWFALALTLLILFVALNRDTANRNPINK